MGEYDPDVRTPLDAQFTFQDTQYVVPQLREMTRVIQARLASLELERKTYEGMLAQLSANYLQRINESIIPLYESIAEISHLGAIFTAHSTTAVDVGSGGRAFTIDELSRETFAPAAFMAAISLAEDPQHIAVFGTVTGYNRETGELTLTVVQSSGSGTRSDWFICPTPPPMIPVAYDAGYYTDSPTTDVYTPYISADTPVSGGLY